MGSPTIRPLDPRLLAAAQQDVLFSPKEIRVPASEFTIAERRKIAARVCQGVWLGTKFARTPWTLLAAWTVRYPQAVGGLLMTAVHFGLLDLPQEEKPIWLLIPRTEKGSYVPADIRLIEVPPQRIDPLLDEEQGVLREKHHGVQIRYMGKDRTIFELFRSWDRPSVKLPPQVVVEALERRVQQEDFDLEAFADLGDRLGLWSDPMKRHVDHALGRCKQEG